MQRDGYCIVVQTTRLRPPGAIEPIAGTRQPVIVTLQHHYDEFVIYIIADDLTGATDTGAQFSQHGYTAHVVIVSETGRGGLADLKNFPKSSDVLVIDTETREVDANTARMRLRNVLQHLALHENDLVYKKVDSTLRGNVGAEVDECMQALNKDVCLFTPSFPQNKRMTVEGCLLVHDQPLGRSEYYAGNVDPDEASYIPSLLQQGTDITIDRIDLHDVIHGKDVILERIRALFHDGKKIIVIDSMNTQQLHDILRSSFEFEGSVLYAGSAGLANALSGICDRKRPAEISPAQTQQSVLIVSGSMRSVTHRQIAYIKTHVNVCDVPLDVGCVLENKYTYLRQILDRVTQASRAGCRPTLMYPDPRYLDTQITKKLLSRYGLDFRELGLTIRNFLGEFVRNILEKTSANNLILTGGDTAVGVCGMLDIHHLTIVEELLPGIPRSIGRFNNNGDVNIVTKAGGFGEEDALHVLYKKLVAQESAAIGKSLK